MLRLLVGFAIFVGASLGYPRATAAQPQSVTITITSGGAPVPNANLSFLFDAQPEPVATTSASGVAQFASNRLRADLSPGSAALWRTEWCSRDRRVSVYFKGKKYINPMWAACPADCLCKEQRSFTVHDTMAFELPRESFGGDRFLQNAGASKSFVKSVDFQGGVKRSTFPSVNDSIEAISAQLGNLNYNIINSEKKQDVGLRGGAGIAFGWGDTIKPRLGFAYEKLGTPRPSMAAASACPTPLQTWISHPTRRSRCRLRTSRLVSRRKPAKTSRDRQRHARLGEVQEHNESEAAGWSCGTDTADDTSKLRH